MKTHNVFHVSKLKSHIPATDFSEDRTSDYRPAPMMVDGQEEYEVDYIVNKRMERGWVQYLVHWTGYSDSERTWVDSRELGNCWDLVETFEDNLSLRDKQTYLQRGGV